MVFARISPDQNMLSKLEPVSFSQMSEENDPAICGRKQAVILLSSQDQKKYCDSFQKFTGHDHKFMLKVFVCSCKNLFWFPEIFQNSKIYIEHAVSVFKK